MSIKSKLKTSRESCKDKAIIRGKDLLYQRKENRRIKKEHDPYKKQPRQAYKQLEKERQKNTPAVYGKEELIHISLSLFIDAGIGLGNGKIHAGISIDDISHAAANILKN